MKRHFSGFGTASAAFAAFAESSPQVLEPSCPIIFIDPLYTRAFRDGECRVDRCLFRSLRSILSGFNGNSNGPAVYRMCSFLGDDPFERRCVFGRLFISVLPASVSFTRGPRPRFRLVFSTAVLSPPLFNTCRQKYVLSFIPESRLTD